MDKLIPDSEIEKERQWMFKWVEEGNVPIKILELFNQAKLANKQSQDIETLKEALDKIEKRGTMESCCFTGGEKARYKSCIKMRDIARQALSTIGGK